MVEPQTREQIEDWVSEKAREGGHEPWEALRLAQNTVDAAIESGYLREWGFTTNGELLYERTPAHTVIYVLKEKK